MRCIFVANNTINRKIPKINNITLPEYVKHFEKHKVDTKIKDFYLKYDNRLIKPDSLTGNGESGIINETEYGIPYGECSLIADFDYIYSKEYTNKYNITDNPETNKKILDYAHREHYKRYGIQYMILGGNAKK